MRFGFVLRRIVLLLLVIWLAGTLNFIAPRLASGDPIGERLGRQAAAGGRLEEGLKEMTELWNKKFGLDQPLLVQYGRYLRDTFTFNFGYSIARYPAKVNDLISAALPWTLGLLSVATVFAFGFGILLGALLAWPGAPRFVHYLMPAAVTLSAIPYYLLGMVLVSILAFTFHFFPLSGGYELGTFPGWNWRFIVDVVRHATLPALSMVLAGMGFWAVSMRGMMVTTQGEDYMVFAEAKGLKGGRRFLNYAVRNALLPQVTGLALSMGHVFAGAVLVEIVFGYPGIGTLLYHSVRYYDYFTLYGLVFIVILAIGLATFLVDMIYPLLDPRVTYERR